MYSLKEITEQIVKVSKLSEEEVKRKIEEKQTELSGLVSLEGAAYIVGKELGVNLLKETKKKELKIKNVVSGMNSVDLAGRVVDVSERRDFEKGGRSGSVVNVVLGDETGTIRLSLWNKEIEIIDKLGIRENGIISVAGCYVKEDNRGSSELRLGKFGRIEKVEGEDMGIPRVEVVQRGFEEAKLKCINDLKENEYSEVRASLVQLFRRNPFFEVCPECEGRIEKSGDVWVCKDHGNVEPKYQMVISGVMDDGSGNMRVVFFRDLAEKVLGEKTEDLKLMASKQADPLSIYENLHVLGREFIIRGRTKKNQFTERTEFIANGVETLDVEKESKNLLERIGEIKD
jgi:replication factor A1